MYCTLSLGGLRGTKWRTMGPRDVILFLVVLGLSVDLSLGAVSIVCFWIRRHAVAEYAIESTAIFVLTFLRRYLLFMDILSVNNDEWFESYHLPHSPHKKKNKRKNPCFVKSRIREKALIAECRIEYSWVVIYFFFLKRPSAEIPKQVKFIYNS